MKYQLIKINIGVRDDIPQTGKMYATYFWRMTYFWKKDYTQFVYKIIHGDECTASVVNRLKGKQFNGIHLDNHQHGRELPKFVTNNMEFYGEGTFDEYKGGSYANIDPNKEEQCQQ